MLVLSGSSPAAAAALWEQPFSHNPLFCLLVAALADVTEVVEQLQGSLIKMENFQKLLELKKDLIGIDNLVVPGRVSGKRRQDFQLSRF